MPNIVINGISFFTDKTTYYYKDKPYQIITRGMMKINDVWLDSVTYMTMYDHPDGKVFTRPYADFIKNYKPK